MGCGKRKLSRVLCLLLCCAGIGNAQLTPSSVPAPSFEASRVLPANSAQRIPLAPGMLVSIYGERLGPRRSCKGERAAGTWIFPAELCETQVLVGGQPAGLLYVQEKQINLEIPMNMPEGLKEFRVIQQGRSSQPVTLEVRILSLYEPASVHMPVWLRVELPYGQQKLPYLGRESIRYPFSVRPWNFWIFEFEVRRDGRSLPKIPVKSPLLGGVNGFGQIGLPREPKHKYRIPLHLQYRFDEPGVYEVRYTAYRNGWPWNREVVDQSEWTKIEIRPFSEAQRLEWLQKQKTSAPTDAVELLSDFLPSVLAYPDDPVLPILLDYVHHPDRLVQEYVIHSLGYYGEETIAEVIPDLIRRKGPTERLAYLLSSQRDLLQPQAVELVETIIPFLRSASPQQAGGALHSLQFLRAYYEWDQQPGMPARIEQAVMSAAEHILTLEDQQALSPLAQYLGNVKSDRARELLWELTEWSSVWEQAFISLSGTGGLRDLPRLADLLKNYYDEDDPHNYLVGSGLPSALRSAYGVAAIPHLKAILKESKQTWVRVGCAQELALAGEPEGFLFLIDAIEQQRFYKHEMIVWLRNRFPEKRLATEQAILTFLKEKAAASSPEQE